MPVNFRRSFHFLEKTLASKFKNTISRIKKISRQEILYKVQKGIKCMILLTCKNVRTTNIVKTKSQKLNFTTAVFKPHLKSYLNAKKCKLCGTIEGRHYKIHK